MSIGSPYFRRFVFKAEGGGDVVPVHVGVHGFYDEEEKRALIFDWRAPSSTLFYDCEPGPTAHQAPSGTVPGEIRLKRQFRIRDGRVEFMLDSGLHIVDDVLQKELQRALAGAVPRLHLLTTRSTTFSARVIICTAHLAKGLEFDGVIVPQADQES